MNDRKLNQLFATARRETPPGVPADFAERVQRGLVKADAGAPEIPTLWEQLNRGFTRYALAAAAMIVLCAAFEISHLLSHEPSMDDDVNQICSDWMLR